MIEHVTIYGKEGCVFCTLAVNLCNEKGIAYDYKDIYEDDNLSEAMARTEVQFKTVPQIFSDNLHIGGYTELLELVWGYNTPSYETKDTEPNEDN